MPSRTNVAPAHKSKRDHKAGKRSFGTLIKDNALSIVTVTIFLLCWIGQSVAGNFVYNDEAKSHGEPTLNYVQYVASPHFWSATAENWESEFLQLSAMVLLTIFLKQKGSAESKSEKDFHEDSPPVVRKNKVLRVLYENSLGIALFLLFLGSFSGHVASSYFENSAEQQNHGQGKMEFAQFVRSPQLWFESLQNWQSEFLAVSTLAILSIWLRQKGSAESKNMEEGDSETGK
jgi:hypothetical protein